MLMGSTVRLHHCLDSSIWWLVSPAGMHSHRSLPTSFKVTVNFDKTKGLLALQHVTQGVGREGSEVGRNFYLYITSIKFSNAQNMLNSCRK